MLSIVRNSGRGAGVSNERKQEMHNLEQEMQRIYLPGTLTIHENSETVEECSLRADRYDAKISAPVPH